MFPTELYQQVLGLTASWKMTDVMLDVESTGFTFMPITPRAVAGTVRLVTVRWRDTTTPPCGSGGI